MSFDAVIITCEHATATVPVRWREPFRAGMQILDTHRAWDPGAMVLARQLARHFDAPLFRGLVTRLLVDLNRREDAGAVFSEYSRQFTPEQRTLLLNLYHRPFRVAVQDAVEDHVRRGRSVLHLSCHSFTPVLDGRERSAEIGLLFDPARTGENRLCRAWQTALRKALPDARVKLNYPYRGTSDGMTTWLRQRYPARRYAGIEIELNQKFAAGTPDDWAVTRRALIQTLPQ